MSYSDFTLKKVKSELKLQLIEDQSLFENIQEVKISNYLTQTLKRNVPLALAINTDCHQFFSLFLILMNQKKFKNLIIFNRN